MISVLAVFTRRACRSSAAVGCAFAILLAATCGTSSARVLYTSTSAVSKQASAICNADVQPATKAQALWASGGPTWGQIVRYFRQMATATRRIDRALRKL